MTYVSFPVLDLLSPHDLQPWAEELKREMEISNSRRAPMDSGSGSVFRRELGTNYIIFDKISLVYLIIVDKVRYEKKILCLILVCLYKTSLQYI